MVLPSAARGHVHKNLVSLREQTRSLCVFLKWNLPKWPASNKLPLQPMWAPCGLALQNTTGVGSTPVNQGAPPHTYLQCAEPQGLGSHLPHRSCPNTAPELSLTVSMWPLTLGLSHEHKNRNPVTSHTSHVPCFRGAPERYPQVTPVRDRHSGLKGNH